MKKNHKKSVDEQRLFFSFFCIFASSKRYWLWS